MIILDALIVILTITSLPVLTMLGVALIAFVNSFLLEIIFKKIIPKDERDVQDMRPLFADESEDGEEPIYHMFVRNSDDSTGTPAEGEADPSGETAEAAGASGVPEGQAGGASGSEEPAESEPEITKTEN